jgi:8-oxo-dGTP pyrophosphatase MutT (NUDIX family)
LSAGFADDDEGSIRHMDRNHITRRLAGRPAGRRGFGGTDDPYEAAEFRAVLRGDHDLNPGMSPPSTALRPAAVLVPLLDHSAGMSVLLTQRTAHLSAHAGQISFPGGRIEDDDTGAIAAALRETHEEVGLPPDRVEIIGRLDTYITGTGFEITPIVGLVEPPYPLAIDPFEVAEAFEVPLAFILDPRNHQRVERESAGRRRCFFVLPYEGRNIWGATAGILVNLAEVLAD